MFDDAPTGLPALAALAVGFLSFLVALFAKRLNQARDEAERNAPRSRQSAIGVGVQVAAFLVATFGRQLVVLNPLSPVALAQAALVLALWLGATALFVAATRAMGRNWSIVARTREDHELIQSGPFAMVRHPIYTAIALQLIGCAVALGHPARLIVALPLYALGTWLRISVEERLLHALFGARYDAYARRVKRFVPGVF